MTTPQGEADFLGLSGQVTLVTGATSGIGRCCAIAFAQRGALVAINHLPRSQGDAETLQAEIESLGGTAFPVAADVSKEAEVDAMVRSVAARFGTVHILVNNAGIERKSAFQDMSLDEWTSVLNVNLTGQFLCARAVVREFLQRGMEPGRSKALGKIVCISSVHQMIPWAFQANYAASKGGVALLMQSMAQEFGERRIRINAVAPGAIRTRINSPAWETEEALENLLTLVPYGRIGEPEDVANAVLWLGSDLSDYVTGTTLFVDGGMSLYPAFRGNG